MTRFVTPTSSVVLSPAYPPEHPDDLPKVFDDFERTAHALERGEILYGYARGRILARPSEQGTVYCLTPLLEDGFTLPELLPEQWKSRITKDIVAEFMRAEFSVHVIPPRWGAGMEMVVRADHRFELSTTVDTPLIDPFRDALVGGDDLPFSIQTRMYPPWDSLLTQWEHIDAFFGRTDPEETWFRRRVRRLVCHSGRWWWELRGLQKENDAGRYEGMWRESLDVTAFLGWPAFFLQAAGHVSDCVCGRKAIEGRVFCGAPECNKERARLRQRESRKAQAAIRRSDHVDS